MLKFFKNHYPRRVKTPTLLQMEAVECGAAALGIILGYYGRIVPLAELRVQCGVSRDGSKAGNIVKAAKRYGLIAQGYKSELEQLAKIPPPYIVFWNFNHFLVVEGFTSQRVYLNDPASGPRSVSFSEFDAAFTGVVLAFQPGTEFQRGGKKPSLILALAERLRGSMLAIIYCILAGFLLVIPGIAIPVFSQIFVDQILIENRTDWLRPLLLVMGITVIVQGLLMLLQLRFLRQLKLKLAVGMSGRFLWHILRLPVNFYAQRFAGEISDRIQINDRVADVLSGQLATTVINTIMVIFYAGVMFAYDPILTGIGIIFGMMNVVTLQAISRQRIDANLRLMQDRGKVAGVTIAGLQGIETIKASALESDFFARWSGYYTKVINAQQELDLTNQTLGILPILLNSLTILLILVIGGLRVMDGNLTIGMLVAFQSLMQSFQEPINNLVNFGSTLQELEADLNRLDDVLQNPTDPILEAKNQLESTNLLSHFPNFKLQGYVELCNVTFGYSQIDAPLLEDFSFTLKPGQRVAIVGKSGSGKSTVAKLISGLYQPWSGEILLDGIPLEKIPRSVLTNSLSMVEQEIFLFSGTIRDNLTLWETTIPDSQLVKACTDAAIYDVLRSLPGGLDAEIMEGGVNFSGGQRQRLEIARALVNNPTILVMDEATSALDAEIERIIDQNLRCRGCTCIIVAHRLSTIRDCDEIIVLDNGHIVERGTHAQMWENKGFYTDLIRSASGNADTE
jgi:ATP-binding cassette, subfamily C, bacterial